MKILKHIFEKQFLKFFFRIYFKNVLSKYIIKKILFEIVTQLPKTDKDIIVIFENWWVQQLMECWKQLSNIGIRRLGPLVHQV